MMFTYLWDWFEYFLNKSTRPKRNLDVKPRSMLFVDGTAQSHVGEGTISMESPPPCHSTVTPSPCDVEDHVHTHKS